MTAHPAAPSAPPAPKSAQQVAEELKLPFHSAHLKSKPLTVSGKRALALFYVDARVVQGRLDGVLGINNWKDSYETLPDGSVLCRLSLRIEGEWVTKEDVGSPSEQPDEHDRTKAAHSDALKRAAVKFGVGRYLYTVPNQWCDYDPQKRQFVRPPQVPHQHRHPSEKADAPDRAAGNSSPTPGPGGDRGAGAASASGAGGRAEAPDGPVPEVTEESLTGSAGPKDRPVEQEQFDMIEQLMGATGVTAKKIFANTERKYGVSGFENFTYAVADNVIRWLADVKESGEAKRRQQRESNSAGKRSGTAGH